MDLVRATVGGLDVPVTVAGPSDAADGMDVISLGPLPPDLVDKGVVSILLIIDGRRANAVVITLGKTPPAAPALDFTPPSLDFGVVPIGQSKDLKATLRNSGTASLDISSLSNTSAAYGASPVGPLSVAPGEQADVTVRFTPKTAGVIADTLSISSNDPSRPQVAILLSGTGQSQPVGAAVIDVTPAKLDFGTLVLPGTRDLTLTISGAGGTAALVVQSVDVSGARFSLVNSPTFPATLTLAPLSLVIRYSPVAAGTDTGTITIRSNASNQPVIAISVTATAAAAGVLELKVDDGTFEGSAGFKDGASLAHYLNRLTPPAYPATLTAVRIYFNDRQGAADENTIINVLSASTSAGGSVDGLRLAGSSGSIKVFSRFVDFTVAPITINSGDFIVGFSMANPVGVYPVATDTNSPAQGRSYISQDGSRFTPMPAANLAIRAQVTVGR